MISLETQKLIIQLHNEGLSIRKIAEQTNVSLTTVNKYIKTGIIDPKTALNIDMTNWRMSEHGVQDSRVTVQEYLGRNRWKCLCDCGKIFNTKGTALRSGATKSCGCLQKETVSNLFAKDLTGQRFGKLTVLSFSGNINNHGEKIYQCKCDCGNQTEVATGKLTNGDTQSCGCLVSKGEALIKAWLTKYNINFISQYSFPDLALIRPLKFDFYIPSKNILIEYQGIQHEPTCKKEFGYQQRNITDLMKKAYCIEKNIPLIEIWYYDNLEQKLTELFITNTEQITEQKEKLC